TTRSPRTSRGGRYPRRCRRWSTSAIASRTHANRRRPVESPRAPRHRPAPRPRPRSPPTRPRPPVRRPPARPQPGARPRPPAQASAAPVTQPQAAPLAPPGSEGARLLSTLEAGKESLRGFLIAHSNPAERAFFLRSAQSMFPEERRGALSANDLIVVVPTYTV